MTRKDFVDMAHSDLNDWCIKHNLRGCKEGDCGALYCIWCGEAVDKVLEEITKHEETDEC